VMMESYAQNVYVLRHSMKSFGCCLVCSASFTLKTFLTKLQSKHL
jgi:hypothetical protein